MDIENIISKNFLDLKSVAKSEKINYLKAQPFPSIVFNNFFKEDYLDSILKDFPDLAKLKESQNYNVKNEIKLSNNNYAKFPQKIKSFIDFLNSDIFLDFLQEITSVEEKLITDPNLEGGGLHEIKNGGILKVHTDFNRHPFLDLDRRINVLIYLNKLWKDSFKGHLELWDKDMTRCVKKILPSFNTLAIFSTTDFSNHGHPEHINCPENLSRKSIALYYFSSGRPDNEVINKNMKSKTYFKSRSGIKNDADEKKEVFKNFIRSFKLYRLIKNFEKKYIRRSKKSSKGK